MLKTPYEEKYKGFTIKVDTDPDPTDPREWDNLGTMICAHRRYILGDEQDRGSFDSLKDMYNHLVNERGAKVILQLYLYDHSGLAMNTSGFSCRWDSGSVGFIYATREDIQKWYGVKNMTKKVLADAKRMLEIEVEEYDKYLKGDAYMYSTFNEDGEVTDSCCGFSEAEYALAEARSIADYYATAPGTQTELNFGG
jgi:hypothetical protein